MIEDTIELISGGIKYNDKQNYQVSVFFDYIEEETKTGQANITDNFVEANYAIQDHIALTPKTYRLKGYVGEITYQIPETFLASISNYLISNTPSKLQSIYKAGNALSPVVSSYTQAAKNVVNLLNDSYNRYSQIINNIKGNRRDLEGLRQNTCSSILFHLMDNRVPLSINGLKFERLDGKNYNSQYFIQSVQSHQGDSIYMSDFEVVLKELRIVESKTTKINEKELKEANAVQTTDNANNGKATTKEVKNMSTPADRPKYMSTSADKPKYMSTLADRPKNVVSNFTSSIKKDLK